MAPRPASFSFVHAADLHLDTPFSGVHAVAPHVARALRDASLAAFDAVVELAISRGVAFALFAGDIYDGAERGLRAQLHFREGLGRLSEAGIASFVVHGNHDPVESGWSALGDGWPAGVTVFGAAGVEVFPVEREGMRIATVQGVSYAHRETTENLALGFSRPDGEGLHIGLLHCNVAGSSGGHANYAPCSLEDLRATRLDYLALGHVHERRIVATGNGPGDPWVVYPGNTQARSPRPTERGAKGALVVEVRDGLVLPPEFVACDRVRFAEVASPIGALADLGELEAELLDLAREAAAAAGGRSVVLRVRLEGQGTVHEDLARPGLLGELLDHLRRHGGADAPFVWWDSVNDGTRAAGDEGPAPGEFAADLLEMAATLEDDAALTEAIGRLTREAPRPLQRALDELVREGAHREELLATARRIALSEFGGQ